MMTRREFLARSAVGAGAVVANQAAAAMSSPHTIRFGGPSFTETRDPEELARAHRKLGYSAAYCPSLELKDTALIRAHADAFESANVTIAEVGRWVNLMDADRAKREANLKYVTEGLALADEIGALCCVDIAGSRSVKEWYGPHPDNLSEGFFDAAVENARKILDAVKPRRAKFCYEMMGWALPDSVESCLRLIRAVERRGMGVHLDPCNLVNSPARFYGSTVLLRQCFEKLGTHIVSCHAKDLAWEVEMNVHFKEVVPGTGSLDYATYLRLLAQLPQRPPLMMEHLSTAEEYARGAEHIRGVAGREGLQLA